MKEKETQVTLIAEKKGKVRAKKDIRTRGKKVQERLITTQQI